MPLCELQLVRNDKNLGMEGLGPLGRRKKRVEDQENWMGDRNYLKSFVLVEGGRGLNQSHIQLYCNSSHWSKLKTKQDDCVSAVFFTCSVQLDPIDTFNRRSHPSVTNERAARLLAILPEREKKQKVWI